MISRLGTAALLLLAVPAAMSTERTDISEMELAALLDSAGHQARGRNAYGAPAVDALMDGINYQVEMGGCEDDRCTSMAFTSTVEVNDGADMLTALNAWNRNYKYGKVYVDGQGKQLTLEMNLYLEGGSSDGQIGEYARLWTMLLTSVHGRWGATGPRPR